MRHVNAVLVILLILLISNVGFAGSLDDTGDPTSAGSAMYTLEDLYNRLDTGAAGAKRSGPFTEPSAGPGSSGHTLDEVMGQAPAVDDDNGAGAADVASGKTFWGLKSGEWGLKTGTGTGTIATYPSPVPRTGQTPTVPLDPAPEGSDGDLQKGVAWPNLRFTDNSDGTVTDNLTGLIWLKNADYNSTTGSTGRATWEDALTFCNALNDGECGLSDGSVEGDWRLPNVMELLSLIDWRYYNPALSNADNTGKWSSGDAFTGVQSNYYWSSSTGAYNTSYVWGVDLRYGSVYNANKTYTYYVWPVRGGQ